MSVTGPGSKPVFVPARAPTSAPATTAPSSATPPAAAPAPKAGAPLPNTQASRLLDNTRPTTVQAGQRSTAQSPLFARFQDVPTVGAPSPVTAKDLQGLKGKLAPAPAGATAQPKLGAFDRFWRDFGINPVAMAKHATVDGVEAGGTPIEGSRKANAPMVDSFREALHATVKDMQASSPGGLSDAAFQAWQTKFKDVAGKYGVDVQFKSGAPTVAWGDVPTLEVMSNGKGAGPAAHEMVHAVQLAIGGVSALTTAATDKIQKQTGKAPSSEAEVLAAVRTLTQAERQQAFDGMVKPMEAQAYAHFETGAFEATGMFGKKSSDADFYAAGLHKNIDAFCDAYKLAAVPKLDAGLDARIYGSIGHLARTHGETATLMFGGAALYAKVATVALALNPVVGAAALIPLGYVALRTVTG